MNYRRLKILVDKERKQLLRDPLSIAIGILLPIVLLLIFGYGMSMDIRNIKLAFVESARSPEGDEIAARFAASEYFEFHRFHSTAEALEAVRSHRANAALFLPQDLPRRLQTGEAPFLVVVNAVNATQARLMENYLKGVLSGAVARLRPVPGAVAVPRMWYNDANDSRYYMIPGVIVIIMTLIGTLLTSMVMAREYEHGNLETMFVTPMKSSELLIAKALNNFVLGLIGLAISLAAARWLFDVPIRGSIPVLVLGSSIYLLVALALGLFISSVTKNQFLASDVTLVVTFMPAFLLSGFLYEIDNMPQWVQWITYIVPARYYVEFMQSIFLAGNVWPILGFDLLVLTGFALLFMALAKINNPKSLEGGR